MQGRALHGEYVVRGEGVRVRVGRPEVRGPGWLVGLFLPGCVHLQPAGFLGLLLRPESLLLHDHLLQPPGLLGCLLRPEPLRLPGHLHLQPAGLLGLLLRPESLLLHDHLLQPAGLLDRLFRPETLLLHGRVHLPPAGLLGLLLQPETILLHDHLRLAGLLIGLLLWARLRISTAVATELVLAEMVSADVPSLFFSTELRFS